MFWNQERTKRVIALSQQGAGHPAIAAQLTEEFGRKITTQAASSKLHHLRQSEPIVRGFYGKKRPSAVLQVGGLRVTIQIEEVAEATAT